MIRWKCSLKLRTFLLLGPWTSKIFFQGKGVSLQFFFMTIVYARLQDFPPRSTPNDTIMSPSPVEGQGTPLPLALTPLVTDKWHLYAISLDHIHGPTGENFREEMDSKGGAFPHSVAVTFPHVARPPVHPNRVHLLSKYYCPIIWCCDTKKNMFPH